MKIRSKTFLYPIFAFIIILTLVSCSTSEEKEEVEQAQSSDMAKAEGDATAKDEAGKTVAEQKQPDPRPEEESVIEVIPSQGKATELKVEPIPEEKAEPKAEEPEETQGGIIVEEEKAPDIKVPKSTGPNHFVITAQTKDQRHPFFGKGHPMGFLVNEVPGKEVVIERGKTYKFDVATDPKHDVYFSTKEIGWGSTPFTHGIEGMYTYKGLITVKPDKQTPDYLYYSCRNHPYMGGKVHVVNPGQKAKISKPAASKATGKVEAADTKVTEAQAKQKIMFADMIAGSKNTKAIANSKTPGAVDMYKKAEGELKSAKEKLKAGDHAKAYALADSAANLFKKATKMVPSKAALEHAKEQYNELQASLTDFQASHKDSYERIKKKQGSDAAVDYDKDKVEKMRKEANELAKKGDYPSANDKLASAQRLVTGAIQKMLNAQTIVYDLKFESAQEEYEYERRRFVSYEELIPIAIEQKKPTEQVVKLMDSFVKKGKSLYDRAIQKAKEGDFPTAIAMLQDATKDVRRALRMAGVMQ